MKKIIITGATGFIGTRLIERLACHNYKIFAVIREESTKKYYYLKKRI
ncbi:MAG: NAD(P)-dependent oxidoreductase [Clostridiales bacterium]|nr:NAD(P)-dependent oxidoreductase [Clostridiales bacterium]